MYAAMFFNTDSLIKEVRDVFLGKTVGSETLGEPINRYNLSEYYPAGVDGKINLTLIRLFTLHDFRDGFIWAYYSYKAYDNNGGLVTSSMDIHTKWKIHKENGKWEIVEIYEAP